MRSSGIVIDPPVLDDLPRLAVAGKEVLAHALITQDLAEIEVAWVRRQMNGLLRFH